jgi:hypothetical protein
MGSNALNLLAARIEAAKRVVITKSEAESLASRFAASVAKLEGLIPPSELSDLNRIDDCRVDVANDLFILDLRTASGWKRYELNFVCGTNLMIDIGDLTTFH